MRLRAAQAVAASILPLLTIGASHAQQSDASTLIRDLDAANQARFDTVLGFTDVEHYTVFRGNDQTNPAAELTVKMTFKKGAGKTTPFSNSLAHCLSRNLACSRCSKNEKSINKPATLFGLTVITIDYSDYRFQLRPPR